MQQWIEVVEAVRETINKLPVDDRLQLCGSMLKCVESLRNSCTAWSTWLTSPNTMAIFAQSDLAGFFVKLREATESLLDLNLDASRLLYATVEKEKPNDNHEWGVV